MPFFPEIGKDEFIFAGGGDHELVYEQGQPVGYADLVEGIDRLYGRSPKYEGCAR
jgi:hypothetical protein